MKGANINQNVVKASRDLGARKIIDPIMLRGPMENHLLGYQLLISMLVILGEWVMRSKFIKNIILKVQLNAKTRSKYIKTKYRLVNQPMNFIRNPNQVRDNMFRKLLSLELSQKSQI